MKKLLVFSMLSMVLFSCGSKLKQEGNLYSIQVKLKNGASIEQNVKFTMEKSVVDVNKLNEETIIKMIEDASADCKYSLKNKFSYEFLPETEQTGFIMTKDSGYTMTFDYIGQNSFGVKSKNTGVIEFDKSNKIISSPIL